MTKQSKNILVIIFCVAYLLQPFAALASFVERTFHEEVIGITMDYGNESPVEQVLVFQLDNDVKDYNQEFSDGSKFYGSNVDDNSSSSIAIILTTPTVPNLFESPYEYYLPKNHFKSIPKLLDIRPPISV